MNDDKDSDLIEVNLDDDEAEWNAFLHMQEADAPVAKRAEKDAPPDDLSPEDEAVLIAAQDCVSDPNTFPEEYDWAFAAVLATENPEVISRFGAFVEHLVGQEPDGKKDAAHMEGRVAVLREVHRLGRTHQQTYWIRPKDVRSTDVRASAEALPTPTLNRNQISGLRHRAKQFLKAGQEPPKELLEKLGVKHWSELKFKGFEAPPIGGGKKEGPEPDTNKKGEEEKEKGGGGGKAGGYSELGGLNRNQISGLRHRIRQILAANGQVPDSILKRFGAKDLDHLNEKFTKAGISPIKHPGGEPKPPVEKKPEPEPEPKPEPVKPPEPKPEPVKPPEPKPEPPVEDPDFPDVPVEKAPPPGDQVFNKFVGKLVPAGPRVFLRKNQAVLKEMGETVIGLVGQPIMPKQTRLPDGAAAQKGITEIASKGLRAGVAGTYYPSSGTILLAPSYAAGLSMDKHTAALRSSKVLLHEMMHGASNQTYDYATKDGQSMEEATTEILAQHYAGHFYKAFRPNTPPSEADVVQVERALAGTLFTNTMLDRHAPEGSGGRKITDARSMAYQSWCEGFANMVAVVDNHPIDDRNHDMKKFSDHVAARAIQAKRRTDYDGNIRAKRAPKSRWGLFSKVLLNRYKIPDDKRRSVGTRFNNLLSDFVAGRGDMKEQSPALLRRGIDEIVKEFGK